MITNVIHLGICGENRDELVAEFETSCITRQTRSERSEPRRGGGGLGAGLPGKRERSFPGETPRTPGLASFKHLSLSYDSVPMGMKSFVPFRLWTVELNNNLHLCTFKTCNSLKVCPMRVNEAMIHIQDISYILRTIT
jgi:hypothetical protein